MQKTIESVHGNDEIGDAEVFTFDLVPVVDSSKTTHLDERGLPRVGSTISVGMVIIGKIGKSKSYDAKNRPNYLEIHGGVSEGELRRKYGHMWVDRSVYATHETSGKVLDATMIRKGGVEVARVVIETTNSM